MSHGLVGNKGNNLNNSVLHGELHGMTLERSERPSRFTPWQYDQGFSISQWKIKETKQFENLFMLTKNEHYMITRITLSLNCPFEHTNS